MNIQVEHLDGHVAQLTVHVAADKTINAKKKAARSLAKRINIPGFRPGKAPYKVIARRVGEAAIMEEAVEGMLDETYKQALDESDVQPTAPGNLVNIDEQDNQFVFIFEVPKSPEVTLNDYRAIRKALEIEAVTDEQIDQELESLQEQQAILETVERPAEIGDQINVDILVEYWHEFDDDDDDDDDEDEDEDDDDDDDDEDDDDDDEDDEDEDDDDDEDDNDNEDDDDEDDDDEDDEHGHYHEVMDEHEFGVVIRPEGSEYDIYPGFSEQVVGLSAGDEKVFNLVMPDDEALYGEIAGKTLKIDLAVNTVQSRILPELSDIFAQNTSGGEHETLEGLKAEIRKGLEEKAESDARHELFNSVIDEIKENATVAYHEVEVEKYIDGLMADLDQNLQQQAGVKLAEYLSMTGQSEEALRESRREVATSRLEHELVLLEIVIQEELSVSNNAIDKSVNKMLIQFGEQADLFRTYFDTPDMRSNIANQLLNEAIIKRVVDIALGEDPPIGPDPEDDTEDDPEDDASQEEGDAPQEEGETSEEENAAEDKSKTADSEDDTEDDPEDDASQEEGETSEEENAAEDKSKTADSE